MAVIPPSLFPLYMDQPVTQVIGSGLIDTIAVIQDTQFVVEVDTSPITVVLLNEEATVNQIEIVLQEQPIEVIPTTDVKIKEC